MNASLVFIKYNIKKRTPPAFFGPLGAHFMIIKKLKTQNRPNLLGTSRKLPKEQNSCVHFAQTKIVELSARVSDNWF